MPPPASAFATVGVGGASSEPITAMSAGTDALHVLDGDDGLLTTVDLATAAVTGSDKLPGEGEGFISADDFARLQELFPADRLVYWFTDATGEYAGIAEDQGHVWVSNRHTGQLVRDPVYRRRFNASVFLARPKGSVLQVDPAVDLVRKVCNSVSPGGTTACLSLAPSAHPFPGTGLIAVAGPTIWAGHVDSPALSVIDRDSGMTSHVTPTGASGPATGLATLGGDLWVAYAGGQVARGERPVGDAGSGDGRLGAHRHRRGRERRVRRDRRRPQVLEIDPSSLAVRRGIDVGGRAEGVAVAPDGSVWVTVSALDGKQRADQRLGVSAG